MENQTHSKEPGGPKCPNHHVDNRAGIKMWVKDTGPGDSRRCEQTDKTLSVNCGPPRIMASLWDIVPPMGRPEA